MAVHQLEPVATGCGIGRRPFDHSVADLSRMPRRRARAVAFQPSASRISRNRSGSSAATPSMIYLCFGIGSKN